MIQKKICLLGAFGVGKTSLVSRFVDGFFTERYLGTVGVKIDKKEVRVDEQELSLLVWDLAGEDDLEQIRPSHMRGAAGGILVVDGCRASTLTRAVDIRRRLYETVGDIPIVLAINKEDLRRHWEVTEAAIRDLEQEGWPVFITSAKSGAQVDDLFRAMARRVLA